MKEFCNDLKSINKTLEHIVSKTFPASGFSSSDDIEISKLLCNLEGSFFAVVQYIAKKRGYISNHMVVSNEDILDILTFDD